MASPSGKKKAKAITTPVKKRETLSASSAKVSSKSTKKQETSHDRHVSLKKILIEKRDAIIQKIKLQLGQSVTDEQARRLESAMDSGDQALVDLEREMGISLQEMRNRERKLIDEALDRLEQGIYGECAECGEEISEKRLQALPFARLCVECQSKNELLEKIARSEHRS